MRRLLTLLGLATIAAMAAPAVAAYREKARRERDGAPVFDETADEIDLAAIFDSVDARSTAHALRGGDVLAWYGGGTLDLREATLDPAGARLRIRAMYGGMELIVPRSWPVVLVSRSVLGGGGDARDPARVDPGSPTLTVEVMAVFGGVGIVDGLDDDIPVPTDGVPA
jgi:hypothetical protein